MKITHALVVKLVDTRQNPCRLRSASSSLAEGTICNGILKLLKES